MISETEKETRHRIREKVLPDWPQAMRRKLAAQYVDLSEAAFEREVYAGRLPFPVIMDKKERWIRSSLDRALEFLSQDHDLVPEYQRKFMERFGGL